MITRSEGWGEGEGGKGKVKEGGKRGGSSERWEGRRKEIKRKGKNRERG